MLTLLSLVASAQYAFSGIHPVQLERGTDTPKCLECHEDKAKGKKTHPAVEMGCMTCHLIRNAGETTRVNLKTARVATLCVQCHADKSVPPRSRVHPPAVQDCLKCHDAHTSANEHLLLKPTSGAKGENLCLECHKQGVNVPDKGSRHAALDMGCETCHVTHKTGKNGQQEFDFHLTKGAPELCVGCHDVKEEKLAQAHKGQPFAGAVCTSCHDPHDSKSPKLMQAYLHSPFADKSCEACHDAAKEGKVVLTQKDSRGVCVTCHEEQAKQIDSVKVQHAGAQGDCTQCHNPHAGKYPRFVRPNPGAACEGCHSEQAEIHATGNVLHQPAYKQSCSVCHTPHGGDREHLLRAETNSLCLACHAPDAKGEKLADSHEVTIFGGNVRLPENYFNLVTPLRLDEKGLGHPQEKHPVGGVLDPSDLQKTKKITCLSCHVPHGGGRALLITPMNGRSVCAQCHANLRMATAPAPVQNTAGTQDKKKNKKRGR